MNVLCVDDNRLFRDSMAERFAVAGYDVDAVDSPLAAIRAFHAHPSKYDLVVTDMEFAGSNKETGETLAFNLLECREKRGYDQGPEIICITGAKSMMKPELVNRLKIRGCHYVLKGTDQYFLEAEAAMIRLSELRSSGPAFVFVHGASNTYDWQTGKQWQCSVGESINQVLLLDSGQREEVRMDPAPRRLFDFLARRTGRRSYSLEEVANAMALDEFYSYWQRNDKTITSDWVKNNILRIRKALSSAFAARSLPTTGSSVVATERFEDVSDLSIYIGTRVPRPSQMRTADIDAISPYSERSEAYRFRGRAFVEHLP